MKIRRLNEDAKRFYVDEIVSALGEKTETERHSFATLDELKQYCKDAGLTKDDIANCGGCELRDILTEEVEKLHTKPNGEYLVKADSGKGYTAFSRDNVAIGGIDNEDAESDDKAIAKFKKNEYSECLNEEYFDTAEYRIQKYEDDIPELMAGMHDDYMEGKLDAACYAEVLKKVYDALAECDYKHTMSAPVATKISRKRVLDALAKLDETNEALGIGAGLALGGAAIGAGMIGSSLLDSVEDKDEETELNELFDIEIDAKGFGGSGNNVHVGPGSMPLTASVEENEDDEALNEGSEKYYAAKYTAVDNSGNTTVKKIYFRCDGTIEDAEKEVDSVIKEPYTDLKVIGTCFRSVAEKDGFEFRESFEYDEYDDEFSVRYDEFLEECSGIRAHKVVMGEDVDNLLDDLND